jgi:hypothetical protein
LSTLLVMLVVGLQLNAKENKVVKQDVTVATQIKEVESLLKLYSSSKDVEFIEMQGSVLNRLFRKSPKRGYLKGIEKLEILIVSKDSPYKEKFAQDVVNNFSSKLKEEYEKLVSMKNAESEVVMYCEKERKQILSITNNKSEMSIICISGNISDCIIDMMLQGEIKL